MATPTVAIRLDVETYNKITEIAADEKISRLKLISDHFSGKRETMLNRQLEDENRALQRENEKLRKENEECKAEMEKTAKVLEKVSLKRQQSS